MFKTGNKPNEFTPLPVGVNDAYLTEVSTKDFGDNKALSLKFEKEGKSHTELIFPPNPEFIRKDFNDNVRVHKFSDKEKGWVEGQEITVADAQQKAADSASVKLSHILDAFYDPVPKIESKGDNFTEMWNNFIENVVKHLSQKAPTKGDYNKIEEVPLKIVLVYQKNKGFLQLRPRYPFIKNAKDEDADKISVDPSRDNLEDPTKPVHEAPTEQEDDNPLGI